MRNYIILNGVNSNTIEGLLISSLPPITKPKIRTQVEEIDGMDGDIVTALGYSAYNKEFEIGLYGKYDVNQVISYFNTEGIVIFSNEEDKYYNYQILDQIDYEKLIRFKTAKIKMHIQPFKYSVTDNEKNFDIINNLISFSKYSKNANGITITTSSEGISVNGSCSKEGNIFIPIPALSLKSGNYVLKATSNGTGADTSSIRIIDNMPPDDESLGEESLTLENNDVVTQTSTIAEETTYNFIQFHIMPTENINYNLVLQLESEVINNSISVRNVGNYFAKPIITIYGVGTIELYLNDMEALNIDMGSNEFITIDVEKMEAFNDVMLLNRFVTGDYDNLVFNVGNNIISWNGQVSRIEIKNYSRWL